MSKYGKTRVAGVVLAVVLLMLVAITRIPALRFMALRTILPMTEHLTVMPLRGNVYWISGGICNTGFIVGDNGVIAIDAQMFVPTARKELEDIGHITSKSVDAMILTHSDPDHINGLPAFPRGMQVIAQTTATAEIVSTVADPNSNGFPPPAELKYYIPTHSVLGSESVVVDGVPLTLIHTGPAHTDGDLVVYLPTKRIVFAGDLITPSIGLYPGIHLNKSGSSLGWIESMKAILALDADVYVSGHGELLSKQTLFDRLKSSKERRAEIKLLFDQGRTLADAKATLHDVPLKGTAAQFPTFIETTYQELAAEKTSAAPH